MKKFLLSVLVLLTAANTVFAVDYQLPDPSFEDWSGATFDGNVQNKYWHASNVEQSALGMTFRFNFAHRETGHTGSYCMMVQDQTVGAAGITETGPGYFSLGYGWQYLEGLNTSSATAGTKGGYAFTARPDTVSVWIKRTGSNTDKEDFHILYYAWTGTAKGTSYMNKGNSCTSTTVEDEESDIRIALDGNECKTTTPGGQVSEGWWRERKTYGSWTNIRVPIYYMNDNAPKKCNLIFSASNYPNFRANSGLYEGNSLYVDDVELIYSSKITKLEVGEKEWKGFDPNSTDVQVYSLGETATAVPDIVAYRGNGSLTNLKNKTVAFPGRKLSGSEITIVKGDLTSTPTTITVKSEDGKSTTVYKIQFQKAASSNAKLAGITVNGEALSSFSATKLTYNVELPYGTTDKPVVAAEKQEDKQTIAITQATSVTGSATILVTAADGKTKQTYTLNFSVGQLADNTLQDILVNGKSVPGFTPSQANYKVSLPVGTSAVPTVVGVSKYPAGAQTITYTLPTVASLDGGQALIKVTTPGNQTPKTYKLTFKLEASSYTYLQDLKVGGVTVDGFEPTNLTYYVKLPMGTTTLPAITWTQGDEYQTVTKVEGGVDGTTRITVKAGNGDESVYKLVFSTEKSEISTLTGIKIGGVLLEGFSPDVTNYTYKLEIGTTELPEIEAVAHDEFQNIVINKGNVNGTTRITVTAGNGNTTIYLIAFSVDAYTDNTLKSIKVDGVELAGFDPEVNEYYYNLPQGTTALPEVTFEKQDENLQTVTTRSGGINGDYRLTVRPQSGASRTYIIHFSVATSSNTALASLSVAGYPIDFQAETLEYHVTLAEGVSIIPAVTYTKAEETQRVLSVLEDTIQIITVTAQSGAKREYKIYFKIQLSANAFLDMIYLDGVALAGFDPQTLGYNVTLADVTCPKITVDKLAGQQVTITSPVGAGTAKILVAPEVGAPNTYTITFVAVPATSVQLANILIDGVAIPSFDPTIDHYDTTYVKVRPTVVGEPSDPSQTIQTMWIADTCWLHVADTLGTTASYYVAFTRQMINNAALASIKADSVEIDGWNPATKDYNFVLPSGSSYPTLSYEKGDASQVVTFGQVSDGKWKFHVVAEDGTSADYTVQYAITKNNIATLANIELVTLPGGQHLDYVETTNNYGPFNLDEGAALPDVKVTAKAGQTVMSYNVSETEQHVLVMAEDGTTNTYIITYARNQSSNALLKTIYVDGKKLAGFEPEEHNYSVTLSRGTTVVPNVFPIGQLDNQTITTYFSRPNGTTRIHVEAQDGTEADYYIAFPVEKSNNTKLVQLTIDGVEHSVDTTTYKFNVPFGTFEPYSVTYKAADGQLIRYQEAPITGETKIIVTSESGEATRTYSISYEVGVPEGANVIKKIDYSYVDKNGAAHTGSINNPKAGVNKVTVPYNAKSFEVTGYEKNYPEQAVLFYNGGIRRGAKLMAIANREDENDVEYNVIPEMEADSIGKLKDLKFNGTTILNFNPNVYNYMVNVTSQPAKTNFVGTAFGGKTVTNSEIDAKKKQITLTVASGETYSVCWYYINDKDPFDFRTGWTSVEQGTGFKPIGWKALGDYSSGYDMDFNLVFTHYIIPYISGREAAPYGENGALLSTIRQGAIRASVPGMLTLGEMTASFGSNGSSTTSVKKDANLGVQFRNTPEWLTFDYKELQASGIDNWSIWVRIGNGSKYNDATYTGSYSSKESKEGEKLTLKYPTQTTNLINAVLNSCGTENAADMNAFGATESADLVLQNMHLTYNSTLTAATVNGTDAPLQDDGTTFLYNLGTSEVITGTPNLKFTGAVHDQMQVIKWLNNGEWKDGDLKAQVINYGENALAADLRDSTIYTVVLHRDAVTSFGYTANFGGYPTTEKGDTTYVNLPYGMKTMPDFTIEPESPHQFFEIAKNNKTVTVKVTNENGAESTTVYIFREVKSNDAALESFTFDGITTVDAENFIFSVTAAKMPLIEYEKKSGLYQLVDINYTADGATLKVTAEDGKTTRTYTVNRINPTVATNGQITEFLAGTNVVEGLGGTTYAKTAHKSTELLSFTRKFDQDSVVFVQTPAKMEWQVYGGEDHTYTWTYPTEPSDNAQLGNILIDGIDFSEFVASSYDYTGTPIYSADSIYIQPVAAESAQTITTTQTYEENGTTYEITVTAEDGATKKTYKVRVDRPKSDDKTLAGIMLDGELIANFNPATTSYTVTLPTPAVKTEQQAMPSITYLAAHPGQTIVMENGAIGELDPTLITVTNELGDANQEYSVTILAEPSHCANLTGIMINGEALEGFEPGRHYYSMELNTENIDVQYAADDRFQTVEVLKNGHNRTVHVVAEDGTTTSDYFVTIFVQSQSSDATLANILLEVADTTGTQMVEIVDFMRTINPDAKRFDPGLNNYDINLPSGTTVPPAVSAQLKMDGQTVEIERVGMKVNLKVKAVDLSENTYTLNFTVPQSKNANLGMIYLNGDSIANFAPDYYFYEVNLPVGTHSLPAVDVQKQETKQTVVQDDPDLDKLQVVIHVAAEDTAYKSTYTVLFHYTRSDADTLQMVYVDGDSLKTFRPNVFFYNDSLAVGTTAFPDLSWEEADEWQTIKIDTMLHNANQMVRQISVVSESLKKNTYSFTYTIRKSSVDTLQMIYVDTKPLEGFHATENEYTLNLSAAYANELNGALPAIDYLEADTTQTVLISQAPDSLSGKSLGYKSLISVTAESGAMRIYTLHYNVEQSSDATLGMIFLGGKPLNGFDAQKQTYRLDLDSRSSLPAVTVMKNEAAQTYDISIHGDSILIDVYAEDATQMTYTLVFNRQLSDNAQLQSIRVEGHPEFLYSFVSSEYDYRLKLAYGEDSIPAITYVLNDSLQTVVEPFEMDTLPNGDIKVTITVIAPNGEDEADYTILFRFTKNNDALLKSILLGETLLENFNSYQYDYVFKHPFGSDSTDFYTADSIRYILSDTLATATVVGSADGTIMITVVAQDEETESTYTIRQIIGLDNDATLEALLLDSVLIKGFDPEITFYTYLLKEGDVPPMITAIPRSENAEEPSIGTAAAGDTCRIICTAADGTERRYYIHFAISSVDAGLIPTANDLLLKRVPGSLSLFAASIRQGVSFVLYDQYGHVVYMAEQLPMANPNDVEVASDPSRSESEQIADVVVSEENGIIIPINPGDIYLYGFYMKDGTKTILIKSGKIVADFLPAGGVSL